MCKDLPGDSSDALIDSVRRVEIQNSESLITKMSEKELRQDLAKWREFGHLMAESYDQLKKKHAAIASDSNKNKQIVEALKEQINKLKALLKHSSNENRLLREELENRENVDFNIKEMKAKIEELTEENRIVKKDRDATVKNLAGRNQEKEILENEKALNNKLVQQLNEKIKV